MKILEIKIPEYLDTSYRDGRDSIPSSLNVHFSVGKCDDWIIIGYIVPTDEDAIIKEIKRILRIPDANPEP